MSGDVSRFLREEIPVDMVLGDEVRPNGMMGVMWLID